VGKAASDTATASEQRTVAVGKVAFDATLTSDDRTFFMATAYADGVATSDAAPVLFYKRLNDTVSVTDALTRALGKAAFDDALTSDFADVIRIAASGVPPQSDHQYATDLYASTYGKNVFEALKATDDFLGEANADDDQTVQFTKAVPENLFATERVTASLQRPFAELFMTNYCDSTYFSQGYVGQERTLT